MGTDLSDGRPAKNRAANRHRRAEVRRPLQLAHDELCLRLRPLYRVRGQDRPLSAVPGRAHPLDPAASGNGCWVRGQHHCHRRANRTHAGPDARRVQRRRAGGLRQVARRISWPNIVTPWPRLSAASMPPARSCRARPRSAPAACRWPAWPLPSWSRAWTCWGLRFPKKCSRVAREQACTDAWVCRIWLTFETRHASVLEYVRTGSVERRS